MEFYTHYLPDKCCPLFRLNSALDVPKEVIDMYLQPQFTVMEYKNGNKINNSALSCLGSIVEVIEHVDPGTRIIVTATAALGKSAFSCHATRQWCLGSALTKYRKLYLTLPRYINKHSEPIERIICTDLGLHDEQSEGELRRFIKTSAREMTFIIDGYDELNEKEQRNSSINDLISGKVADLATVVITSRTHCRQQLLNLLSMRHYVVVSLSGLTAASANEYIYKICSTIGGNGSRKLIAQQIFSHIPEEAKRNPLLLNMAVLIYKWNKQCSTEDKPRTRTDMFGRVIGMFLAIKTEKDRPICLPSVPNYKSPMDDKIPVLDKLIIKSLAEMCFESKRNNEFAFTSERLKHSQLYDHKVLSQLGFLDITKDAEGNLSARCVHNLFLEYCAALHVTQNDAALNKIIDEINRMSAPNNKTSVMIRDLGFWQETLVFATGISPDILSRISASPFKLRALCDSQKMPQYCLDMIYEARLIDETESLEAREVFCKALMKAPLQYCEADEVEVYTCTCKIDLFFHPLLGKACKNYET